jgi:3'(2'), 5'-bisphosphate nucleotidase
MTNEPSDSNTAALTELLHSVVTIAQLAGAKIMEIYATDDFIVQKKDDNTPLTKADMAAHHTIVAGLTALPVNYPILSEESSHIPYQERIQWQCYWLVDPLDGTREFIKRNGEFTVNIALIEAHRPVLGVVYVPVTQVLYYACQGYGAFKQEHGQQPQRIFARDCPADRLIVAGSRSHAGATLQTFIQRLNMSVELVSIGSSLKSCLVAEGKADIYPRFGPTSEWDTAAAQCIVEQAGGHLTDILLQPLLYNTKDSLLNPHFLVFGDAKKQWNNYL